MSHPQHDHAAGHDHRHGGAHDGHLHGRLGAHDHADDHAKESGPAARGSLLDASAALRLVGAAGAMALIWAGVIWATS